MKPADVELDAATADDITPEAADDADQNWESDYVSDGNEEDKLFAGGPEDITVGDEPSVDLSGTDVAAEPVAVDSVADAPSAVPAEPAADDDILADIFNDDDMDVTPEEPSAVTPDIPTVADEPVADPVDTYTDIDGTEIEVPAPEKPAEDAPVDSSVAPAETNIEDLIDDELDDSIIPESKKVRRDAKAVNEARKSIVGITVKKKK